METTALLMGWLARSRTVPDKSTFVTDFVSRLVTPALAVSAIEPRWSGWPLSLVSSPAKELPDGSNKPSTRQSTGILDLIVPALYPANHQELSESCKSLPVRIRSFGVSAVLKGLACHPKPGTLP